MLLRHLPPRKALFLAQRFPPTCWNPTLKAAPGGISKHRGQWKTHAQRENSLKGEFLSRGGLCAQRKDSVPLEGGLCSPQERPLCCRKRTLCSKGRLCQTEDSVPLRVDSVPMREDSVPSREDSVSSRENSLTLKEDSVPSGKESVPLEKNSVPSRENSKP